MKLYIAGASADTARVDAFFDAVLRMDHQITFDWRHSQREHGGISEAALPVYLRKQACDADLAAIREADLCVVLVPSALTASRGAWVELGYACGLRDSQQRRKPMVWCVGPDALISIFTEAADECFVSDERALRQLRAMR